MKSFIKAITVFYTPKTYPKTIVYMLQTTEYQPAAYLRWYWRTQNFNKVMVRRTLNETKAARQLLLGLYVGITIQLLLGILLIYLWHWHNIAGGLIFGIAVIVSYPIVWAHLITVPLISARIIIVRPKEKAKILASGRVFKKHKGIKIAIAGSYGKTSMKELLLSVLSEGKNVAATPANMNVASSHALFAESLSGKEDILLIEYGEGGPGDVKRFAQITHPTHGVITGLAPAHLDHYKSVEAAGEDIFSLAKYLNNKNVYVNSESASTESFIRPEFKLYNQTGVLGWVVSDIKISLKGTTFNLSKGNKKISIKSSLLGRHQVGPIALSVVLAEQFGMSNEQIISGVAAAKPFEHRMQAYGLSGGWVIDDTYNGNIEGIRAGTQLLSDLTAKRKIYVTPGLVDQGKENKAVHLELGRLIAGAEPDVVVLMKNSVTAFIVEGLKFASFKGLTKIEENPLQFYNNLGEFIAAGDVVLMQNDWPDNYA
jgi:UDP-N-acetylmuramoyl-tripeptide--D-alanyl-D-alanine ligase